MPDPNRVAIPDRPAPAAAPPGPGPAPRPIHAADGTRLFHRDWGEGPPILFLAGWALPSDAWAPAMLDLAGRGHRCIAYDRRGHGRSDDPGRGYDFDTLADDLATVLAALELRDAILVGHSMAPGEILRWLARHGAAGVAGLVFVAPVLPRLLRAPDHPEGLDPAMAAASAAALARDPPAWLDANLEAFVTPETSRAMRDWLRGLALGCSWQAMVALNRAVAAADFRAELPLVRLPTLVLHGDADASAPLGPCGRATAALIPGARLEVYAGAPHGLPVTHAARLAADVAAFARGLPAREACA